MRTLEGFRAAYGTAIMAAPAVAPFAAGGHRTDRFTLAVVRVLAGRHLIQALVISLAPDSRFLHAGGAAVDSLHSASMLALALADPRRRRGAGGEVIVAGLFAVAEIRAAIRSGPTALRRHTPRSISQIRKGL
ncbi:MAG TPA: hypothetical protein VIG41_11065 [Micrococcaceae bacterium]|jgi:hypothetical protein